MRSFVKHPGFFLLTCLVAIGLSQPFAYAQNVGGCPVVQNGFSSNGFTYRLTSEKYPPTGDIQSAIRKAYGDRAEIADWNDLKNIATDRNRLQALLLGTGIANQSGNAGCDNILINQAGNSTFQGMHFLFARHDGLKPPGWAILDTIGPDVLHLGRWNQSGRVLIRVAEQPNPQTPSKNQPSVYIIDGLALGGQVVFDSEAYRSYHCVLSEQFAGFTWCQKKTDERVKRGQFTSSYSILHSQTGTALYINRFLEPAWFSGNEANDDITGRSKKYGAPTRFIPMPQQSVVPNGMIVTWGNVILEPLDSENLKQLAAGHDVHVGFMIDHIGNFQRSAQHGLPIYRLTGGAGYVWAASWNQSGQGVLRFLTVDALAINSKKPAVDTSAAPSAKAVGLAPPENNPSAILADAKSKNGNVERSDIKTDQRSTAADNTPFLARVLYPKQGYVSLGTVATSEEMCSIFSHKYFEFFSKGLSPLVPLAKWDGEHLASHWILNRFGDSKTDSGSKMSLDPSTDALIDLRLSECANSLFRSDQNRFQKIAQAVLPWLDSCIVQQSQVQRDLTPDGRLVEQQVQQPRRRCVNWAYDGGSFDYNFGSSTTPFLTMLTLREGHPALKELLDRASQRIQKYLDDDAKAKAEAVRVADEARITQLKQQATEEERRQALDGDPAHVAARERANAIIEQNKIQAEEDQRRADEVLQKQIDQLNAARVAQGLSVFTLEEVKAELQRQKDVFQEKIRKDQEYAARTGELPRALLNFVKRALL